MNPATPKILQFGPGNSILLESLPKRMDVINKKSYKFKQKNKINHKIHALCSWFRKVLIQRSLDFLLFYLYESLRLVISRVFP